MVSSWSLQAKAKTHSPCDLFISSLLLSFLLTLPLPWFSLLSWVLPNMLITEPLYLLFPVLLCSSYKYPHDYWFPCLFQVFVQMFIFLLHSSLNRPSPSWYFTLGFPFIFLCFSSITLITTSWGSWLWHYWHFGLTLSFGIALCHAGCLAT